jgi:oligopeptide/dipeptide ABC transporter ATP-binding protein
MQALLEVRDLQKYFPVTSGVIFRKVRGFVHAVDRVSFSIGEAETLGLVGESGSGKTTTGRLVLGSIKPTAGKVLFEGRDLTTMTENEMKKARKGMGMVFQDPTSSLDPHKTAASIVSEPMEIHKAFDQHEKEKRVVELVEEVGLGPEHLGRYPHEFSGGQLQRIAIARALSLKPKLIVADEPTSALDVSVQAQILNLIHNLQERFRLSFLFISHDLSTVRYISHRVGVMYLGKLVELARSEDLFSNPQHPYTAALINVVPVPDPKEMKSKMKEILRGEISSPINPPKGCRFHPRCSQMKPRCKEIEPEIQEIGKDHYVACHPE